MPKRNRVLRVAACGVAFVILVMGVALFFQPRLETAEPSAETKAEGEQSAAPYEGSVTCYQDCSVTFGIANRPQTPSGAEQTGQGQPEGKSAEWRREALDLLAQKRMAYWAIWLAGFTAVGITLLAATFWEAMEATKAARAAADASEKTNATTREIGVKQVRAYMSCTKFELCLIPQGNFADTRIHVRNDGQSPALDVQAVFRVEFIQRDPDPNIRCWFEMLFGNVAVGSEPDREASFAIQREEDLAHVQLTSPVQARVDLVLFWRDVFDEEQDERGFFHQVWPVVGSATNISTFTDSTAQLGTRYWRDLLPLFRERRAKHRGG